MADKIGLNNEIRELKLGSSFYKKDSPFHTVKYDFKPASVDTSQMANLEIGSNNEVSVTVPHLEGSGTTQTVFKGSKRPYTKECILIIDHKTGEITLERLGLNIQLKKTRAEGSSKVNRSMPTMDLIAGTKKLHAKQHGPKETQKNRKVSPPRVSPTMKNSTSLQNKPVSQPSGSSRPNTKSTITTSASMPTLGLRDELDSPVHTDMTQSSARSVGLALTDSSSESGSSSSSDSSDSEDPDMEPVPTAPLSSSGNHISPLKGSPLKPQPPPAVQKSQQSFSAPSSNNSFVAGKPKNPPIASNLLNDDLCLSESGSDSD